MRMIPPPALRGGIILSQPEFTVYLTLALAALA